jgi:hypothetical protein
LRRHRARCARVARRVRVAGDATVHADGDGADDAVVLFAAVRADSPHPTRREVVLAVSSLRPRARAYILRLRQGLGPDRNIRQRRAGHRRRDLPVLVRRRPAAPRALAPPARVRGGEWGRECGGSDASRGRPGGGGPGDGLGEPVRDARRRAHAGGGRPARNRGTGCDGRATDSAGGRALEEDEIQEVQRTLPT